MILAVVAILLVALGLYVVGMKAGVALYISHPLGFYAFHASAGQVHTVDSDRFQRIVLRLLEGDLFDGISVSRIREDADGIILSVDKGALELSVTFRNRKEARKAREFRAQMKAWGYSAADENVWNIGLGDEMESHSIDYLIPLNSETILDLIPRVLTHLEGEETGSYWVTAWRSKDGPGAGRGISIRRPLDPIPQIL
ncbi:hypothetical protein EON81_26955 [bacterium]|nr:MAG: hypothetical protein EON81_26955 [bacterium]